MLLIPIVAVGIGTLVFALTVVPRLGKIQSPTTNAAAAATTTTPATAATLATTTTSSPKRKAKSPGHGKSAKKPAGAVVIAAGPAPTAPPATFRPGPLVGVRIQPDSKSIPSPQPPTTPATAPPSGGRFKPQNPRDPTRGGKAPST